MVLILNVANFMFCCAPKQQNETIWSQLKKHWYQKGQIQQTFPNSNFQFQTGSKGDSIAGWLLLMLSSLGLYTTCGGAGKWRLKYRAGGTRGQGGNKPLPLFGKIISETFSLRRPFFVYCKLPHIFRPSVVFERDCLYKANIRKYHVCILVKGVKVEKYST